MRLDRILRRRSLVPALAVALAVPAILPSRAGDELPSPVGAYPGESSDDFAARIALARKIDRIDIQAERFEDVLNAFRKQSGLNVVPRWAAMGASAIEKDLEITFQGAQLSGQAFLRLLLELAGGGETELDYVIMDGAVVISTKEDLSRDRLTLVYDCEDLLNVEEKHLAAHVSRVFAAAANYSGRDISRDGVEMERIVRRVFQDSRQNLRNELVVALQNHVDPESWYDAGGNVGFISVVNDRLIITQTRTAHRQIWDLLASLRARRVAQQPIGRWP